jgi:hypothetical protein
LPYALQSTRSAGYQEEKEIKKLHTKLLLVGFLQQKASPCHRSRVVIGGKCDEFRGISIQEGSRLTGDFVI